MKTYERLAWELERVGLTEMAEKAKSGHYHDFMSPLDLPELQLMRDLKDAYDGAVVTDQERAKEIERLMTRHAGGEFDASPEESEEWANSPEGRETFYHILDYSFDEGRKKTKTAGRLAMRQEGDLWKAYYAMPDTMEGALLLGTIQMRLVYDDRRREAFINLMKEALTDVMKEIAGGEVVWPDAPRQAKKNERGDQ